MSEAVENPTAAFLLPELSVIAVTLLTGLLSTGFDPLYGLRVVVAATVLFAFASHFRRRPIEALVPAMIGAGVFVLWLVTAPGVAPDVQETWLASLDAQGSVGRGVWVVLRVLGSVALVPIVEELAFRGYVLRRLIRADFIDVSYRELSVVPVLVSSVLFGALHQRFVVATIAGLAYAFAAYRRDSLEDAMVAHAVTNGLVAVAVLVFGEWTLWM